MKYKVSKYNGKVVPSNKELISKIQEDEKTIGLMVQFVCSTLYNKEDKNVEAKVREYVISMLEAAKY